MVPAAFGMAYSDAAHRHNRRANILECNALLSRSLLRLLRRSEPMLLPIRRVLQAIVSATLILQLDIPATAQAVGVPAGTHMTPHSGTLHVTQDNAIIRNIEIRGNVIIDADNVSMSNVRLVSTTENSALQVKDGADGFVLQDSEIDGGGATASAIDGYGQFLRNDIHGAENGINVTGPSLIRANYIHDLRNKNGSPHYDGIQVDGGRDVQIVENTIINENTQTSAVMLDNYFKGLSDITVERNRLMGVVIRSTLTAVSTEARLSMRQSRSSTIRSEAVSTAIMRSSSINRCFTAIRPSIRRRPTLRPATILDSRRLCSYRPQTCGGISVSVRKAVGENLRSTP
jgi:hypothetical protein